LPAPFSFFDSLTEADLRRRRGVKWTQYPPEVLPVWIADQDFAPAPPIQRVLDEMVRVGDLGYPVRPWLNPLPALFAERQRTRHGWAPDPARVRVLTDVLQAMEAALLLHGSPGDGVIVQTPIYPPFLEAVRTTRRELIENRMIAPPRGVANRRWEIDLDGFRAAAKRARVFLLCNPHNPTGRVFGRDELEAMAQIAIEHDLVVFADEIHQDLLFPKQGIAGTAQSPEPQSAGLGSPPGDPLTRQGIAGTVQSPEPQSSGVGSPPGDPLPGPRHVPFASLGEEVAKRTVTFTSATKSWNIAGLCCAVAHFGPDPLLAAIDAFPPHYLGRVSIVGIETTVAAWREGDPWLLELLAYLDRNRERLASFVRERMPDLDHVPPEATFLAWLDCRGLDLAGGPFRFFLERARVALSDGADFGEAGRGFVRLNFATPRAILDQVLERMAHALDGRAAAVR
jgi:cystathionine beta-lyase